MSYGKIASKDVSIVFRCLIALSGTLILAVNIPWELVFIETFPAGGDNPAHPVLVKSLSEALFSHGSIVHYSYGFWGGFEAFQYYFPVAYILCALLAQIFSFVVAYKLASLVGLLLIPPAFYLLARLSSFSIRTSLLASILAVSFLHTDAHVMWGANITSTMAGMTGNTLGLMFFLVAAGFIFKARRTGGVSVAAVLFSCLTIGSHFYAGLMLFVVYLSFFMQDLVKVLRSGFKVRYLVFYVNGLFTLLIMSWWVFPLAFYLPYSSSFGMNWDISLLNTLRLEEKFFFAVALLSNLGFLCWRRFRSETQTAWLLFSLIYLFFYYAGSLTGSTVFVNVRLWPTIYLSFFIQVLLFYDRISLWFPRWIVVIMTGLLVFLLPASASYNKAAELYRWNFSGVESRESGDQFFEVVRILKSHPSSRASFESNGENNYLLGSVRAFEALPYLTDHEILEGGIVNSASQPGIGYTLQCLASNTCAGWPPGLIVPAKDISRVPDLMDSLGVQFHISSTRENAELFRESVEFEELFAGDSLSLFKLRKTIRKVEVYQGTPLVIGASDPLSIMLATSRFDNLRKQAFVFQSNSEFESIGSADVFNILSEQMRSPDRMKDRGAEARYDESGRYLNSFLYTESKEEFSLEGANLNEFGIFSADRSFSPEIMIANIEKQNLLVLAPLTRRESGKGRVFINGNGFTVEVDGEKFELGKEIDIEFRPVSFNSGREPFALIEFHEVEAEGYSFIDLSTYDQSIVSGFPGGRQHIFPENITDKCNVRLDKGFHKMELFTDCPGKPHLIKYSYYPKWKATVPLYRSTNGFMILTPEKQETVIRHERHLIDKVTIILSWLSFMGLLLYGFLKHDKLFLQNSVAEKI